MKNEGKKSKSPLPEHAEARERQLISELGRRQDGEQNQGDHLAVGEARKMIAPSDESVESSNSNGPGLTQVGQGAVSSQAGLGAGGAGTSAPSTTLRFRNADVVRGVLAWVEKNNMPSAADIHGNEQN